MQGECQRTSDAICAFSTAWKLPGVRILLHGGKLVQVGTPRELASESAPVASRGIIEPGSLKAEVRDCRRIIHTFLGQHQKIHSLAGVNVNEADYDDCALIIL